MAHECLVVKPIDGTDAEVIVAIWKVLVPIHVRASDRVEYARARRIEHEPIVKVFTETQIRGARDAFADKPSRIVVGVHPLPNGPERVPKRVGCRPRVPAVCRHILETIASS